jgi:hypothetical protein
VSWKLLFGAVVLAVAGQSGTARHVIAGRVQGSHGGVPAGVTVRLCVLHDDGGSGCGPPLPLGADGSFRTPPQVDATYVLVAGPSPYASAADPSVECGVQVVRLEGQDAPGVLIPTSRYSLRGKYVMRTDHPAAKWPPHIHLLANLVIGGRAYPVGEAGSTGAPNGEFLLQNILGARVLRAGYELAEDRWWPWQVLLDGVDITDTPTDFSQHTTGKLEYVFTQHPARVAGRVVDAQGRGVPSAWVAIFSADKTRWNDWDSAVHRTQAALTGEFAYAVRPGRYLIAAIAPTAFQIRPIWPSFSALAETATAVTVADRAHAEIVVRLPDRRR